MPPPDLDTRKYSTHLREFIQNPESRMLLDATIDYDRPDNPVRYPRGAFQLTSGRYIRKFVSLWELFDDAEELEKCLSHLAARAIEIGGKHSFNTIVTCTHPAGELLRHLRPRLERELDREIEVCEFGHYPISAAAELELHAFRSRSVLIFTDVMGSGTLVADMATRVIRTAGNVVAALCVVMADSKYRQILWDSPDYSFQFPLPGAMQAASREVPIYPLTDYEIVEAPEGEVDPNQVRKIDFVSAFPEAAPPEPEAPVPAPLETATTGVVPTGEPGSGRIQARSSEDRPRRKLFEGYCREEMLRHFRAAQALLPGFYGSESRSFSLAIRVASLLKHSEVGPAIWDKLRERFEDLPQKDLLLISSVKSDDLAFCRFLRDRLVELPSAVAEDGERKRVPHLVLKRVQGDSPQLHYSLYPRSWELSGKTVILVRATATTSEDMRSIAALLAEHEVRGIHIVCLINRMGKYTASFVQRIERLVTGIGGNRGEADFEFIPVYQLTDVRTDDLMRMHQRVEDVMEKYSRVTDVPHFKHQAQIFRRLMAPRSTHTRAFEDGTSDILEASITFGSEEVPVQAARTISLAEALAEVVEEIVQHRIGRLVDVLKRTTHPEVFLLMAGLVISDVDYLRLRKDFAMVMDALLERLHDLRKHRIEEETQQTLLEVIKRRQVGLQTGGVPSEVAVPETKLAPNSIGTESFDADDDGEGSLLTRQIVDSLRLESHVAFALALLAHFNKGKETAQWILDSILFDNRAAKMWHASPLNLRYHFRDVRNYWLMAFLLHAVHPDFYSLSAIAEPRVLLSRSIRQLMESLLRDLPERAYQTDRAPDLLRGKILDQANHLLLEVGVHSRGLWHQRIRFLQHHLLHRSQEHSPLYTVLEAADGDYDLMAEGFDPALLARLPRRGQEALSAAITLQDAAGVLEDLARYPSQFVAGRLHGLFGDGNATDSFNQKVVSPLLALLENAEDAPLAGENELEQFGDLIWEVKDALLDSTCGVHEVLLNFCVPLYETALDCLRDVAGRLTTEGLLDVWTETIEEVQMSLNSDRELYVLCDPHLLREVLRNFFSNVRYSIDTVPDKDPHKPAGRATFRVEDGKLKLPEPEADELEAFSIIVETSGFSYSEKVQGQSRAGATLEDHKARVEEFGGNLQLGDSEGGHGSVAVLQLISRARYGKLVSVERDAAAKTNKP